MPAGRRAAALAARAGARARRRAGGGRAAGTAVLAAAAAVLLRGWPGAPAWLAAAPAWRRAPARSARLAAAEAPTVGRPFGDLKVGETLEGRVAFRNHKGVYVDVGVYGANGFGQNGAVFAPLRQANASLAVNQTVSATVERVESDKFWVSVDGVPKLKLLKDLRAGETLDGFVAIMRQSDGILLDVGAERLASVLAPKSEWKKLKLRQDVVATIERVEGDNVWASVDGLTKSRLSSDLKVGEKLEGRVVRKRKDAVLVDVGCELLATVFAPRKVALNKLEPNQTVTATVERVDDRSILVSVKGLPKPKRLLSDLKVGVTLTGKVAYKSRDGVFVDIGGEDEARVFAPKLKALDTLEIGQTVSATVEETKSLSTWVSVEGLPKMKKIEDLEEGEVIEGVVAQRTQHGVNLDIGSMAMARVLAPRDDALEKLKYQEAVSATIVKIRSNYILASVPGLPTLKLLEDFQEGQLVDGFVASRNADGVLVDIGCERLGLLSASRGDVFKLESFERLQGLRIETVDLEEGRIDLSLAGLEDLVAGRAERPPSSRAAKEKESAVGKKPGRRRRKRSRGASAPAEGAGKGSKD